MNRIAERRKQAGLTQAALGKAVRCNQQLIQRIESGQDVGLDLAIHLAKALKTDVGDLFPGLGKALKTLGVGPGKAGRRTEKAVVEAKEALAKGGIDVDPRQWHLVFTMSNGVTFRYRVSSPTVQRFWSRMQVDPADQAAHRRWCWFDSDLFAVWVDPQEIQHAVACFDAPEPFVHFVPPEGISHHTARFFFRQRAEPLAIRSDPDPAIPDHLQEEMADGAVNDAWLDAHAEGQFRTLDMYMDFESVLSLEDEDGEMNLIATRDLVLVEVPHVLAGLVDPPDGDDLESPGDEP